MKPKKKLKKEKIQRFICTRKEVIEKEYDSQSRVIKEVVSYYYPEGKEQLSSAIGFNVEKDWYE